MHGRRQVFANLHEHARALADFKSKRRAEASEELGIPWSGQEMYDENDVLSEVRGRTSRRRAQPLERRSRPSATAARSFPTHPLRPPPHPACALARQANLEPRYALRHHIGVTAVLNEWWQVTQDIDGRPGVQEGEYSPTIKKASARTAALAPTPTLTLTDLNPCADPSPSTSPPSRRRAPALPNPGVAQWCITPGRPTDVSCLPAWEGPSDLARCEVHALVLAFTSGVEPGLKRSDRHTHRAGPTQPWTDASPGTSTAP
eukprot:scaffold13163_cov98-Isochrysis_galbana.AAC.4